jgi:hypothetical protein
MRLAALLLAAPALYWCIGLGCLGLLDRSRERVALAPLLGFAVAGWLPQLALALGGVPYLAGAGLLVLGLLPLRSPRELWRPDALRALGLFGFCYAVGIAIFGLVPLPALGLWGTDWAIYLRAGPALLEYAADPSAFAAGAPELMAERPRLFASRPHLFSTAIRPIAGWAPPLVVLEIAAAVAAASLVSALGFVASRLGRPEPTLLWAGFFVSLPLFGYHLIALWPKLAATGFVLVAAAEAYAHRASGRNADLAFAFGWLGFAIAAHHSSVLYLPLLLLIVAWDRDAGTRLRWPTLARALVFGAGALLLTAGIYELWALARLGLAARIENNPAVHQAASFEPVFLLGKTAKQLWLAIVGGSFPHMGRQLTHAAGADSTSAALGHASSALSSWLVFLAGTFLGNLLPLLIAACGEVAAAWRSFREHELFAPVLGAGLLALIGSALLAPILDLSAAQLGATPICVALVYFASSGAGSAALRRALGFSLVLGTLPFAAHALATRRAFQRALDGDRALLDWFLQYEGDTRLVLSLDATSLAQAAAPPSWVAIAVWLALAWWLCGRVDPVTGAAAS